MTETYAECKSCGVEKPLTEDYFHKDAHLKSGFKGTCKVCRETSEAAASDAARDALLVKIESQGRQCLAMLVSETTRSSRKTPHVAEMFQHIINVFGGPEGFARQVGATYFSAPPGGATRQRILMDVARMGTKVSEQGYIARDLKDVATDDLERLLDERLRATTLKLTAQINDAETLRENAG